jgi:hypothetical protein
MVRATIAVLLAPAFIATLLTIANQLRGSRNSYTEIYFVFSYVFALIPGALAMVLLKKLHYRRLWHFVLAGILVAVVCTAGFIVQGYGGSISSFGAWLSYFLRAWQLLVIGPLTGVFVWVVSESPIRRSGD